MTRPPFSGVRTAGAAWRLDYLSVAGFALAIVALFGGFLGEGGSAAEILKPTAALIVIGGTAGACLLTTPRRNLRNAILRFREVLVEPADSPQQLVEQLSRYSAQARRGGIVSLEKELERIPDPFLRKAMMLAVDGADLKEIEEMMSLEIDLEEVNYEDAARVFTQAGGYSPTIGIIGAVLGLMQVMKNIGNMDEVGTGIATAFVATLYGVGFANIFLLPAGGKIRARGQERRQLRLLVLQGTLSIVRGLNPTLLQTQLQAFVTHWRLQAAAAPGRREAAIELRQPVAAGEVIEETPNASGAAG